MTGRRPGNPATTTATSGTSAGIRAPSGPTWVGSKLRRAAVTSSASPSHRATLSYRMPRVMTLLPEWRRSRRHWSRPVGAIPPDQETRTVRSSPRAPASRRRRIVASANPNGAGTTIATRSEQVSAAASIPPGLGRVHCHACLDEHVPARGEGGDRDRGVEVRQGRHDNRIHVRIRNRAPAQSGYVRGIPSPAATRAVEPGVRFTTPTRSTPGSAGTRDVARPGDAARPDEPDADPLRHPVPPCSTPPRAV